MRYIVFNDTEIIPVLFFFEFLALRCVGSWRPTVLHCQCTMHYNDVIMSAMVSQITSPTIVYLTAYSRRRSKLALKLRVTGLCAGNSPVTGEFPTQRASNAENAFDDVIVGTWSINSVSLLLTLLSMFRNWFWKCRLLNGHHFIQAPCDKSVTP